MTPAIRHALSFTLFAIVAFAFSSAFTSSPASTQGLWDHNLGPRGTVFSPNRGQASPAQSQTPSMSRPSSAGPALKNKNRPMSKSLSEPGVQKGLSLTDDQ